MSKRALITGITGQDGSYLTEFLLGKGYEVHGLVRQLSTAHYDHLLHVLDRIEVHSADMLDPLSLVRLLEQVQPDEIYNLAAQSFVSQSWDQPILTAEVTGVGVTRILEAIRQVDPGIRFYQASSSEMFGNARQEPQTEATSFWPRSPYGVAKVYGHWITVNYRESFGMHACAGILFNHESPRRGKEFVTRKITSAAARIKHGLQDKLFLGNLDARRDWGFAGDYVRAMWLMLQQETPSEYVVATGKTHTVRDVVDVAFARAGIDPAEFVEVDPRLKRPAEVAALRGDASRAREELGWAPEVDFQQLIEMMVDYDLALAEQEQKAQTTRK